MILPLPLTFNLSCPYCQREGKFLIQKGRISPCGGGLCHIYTPLKPYFEGLSRKQEMKWIVPYICIEINLPLARAKLLQKI